MFLNLLRSYWYSDNRPDSVLARHFIVLSASRRTSTLHN
nr:MAG TPA: hypothetical protein [Caudoviricetes sp.]